MTDFSLNPIGNSLLVSCLALALLALLALGPIGSRTTPRRKAVLLGLRLVVFLLVILAMLRPAVVYTRIKKQQATLVLLLDYSRSMKVADAVGNKSRWEALSTTLNDALPTLGELAEDLEIKLYTFDAEAHALPFDPQKLDLAAEPDGEETAIGWVLEDVLRRETGKRLAGVILMSDGMVRAVSPRDVPPQVPAGRMRDLNFQLHTLAFGQTRGLGQARDVALRDMLASQTVFVKNQLMATGNVRIDGYVDQQLPIQLLFETAPGKMQIVDSQLLRATQDGQQLGVEMAYIPQVPGEYKVTLQVPAQPGELVTTNNHLSTFVTVLKGGLSVLYLEGTVRPEMAFLRRSLDASPDIKVDFLRLDPRAPDNRPTDLAERFQPGKYDVFILGDLDSSLLKPDELEALRQRVDGGAGLIMLGGLHSFGPGGYAETPLAEVLPVQMLKLERQRVGEAPRTDVHLLRPIRMLPTDRGGNLDYVTRLSTENNRQAWDKLPPLDGANKFVGLKPAAHLLAAGPAGELLLAAQESGRGRTLAFAGDSTWRWCLHGQTEAHRRFWRQVVLWLARKDQLADGNVWIRLDQRRFGPNSRVEFTTGARSADGQPIIDADVQAELELPDGSRQNISLARRDDEFVGSVLETGLAGDYTIRVSATLGGESVGNSQARFLVYEQDLELDNSAADRTLLDSLAAMTGGKALVPEQLPGLLTELRNSTKDLEIEVQTKQTLWDTWPAFLLLTILLCLEWYLRKKWGLV